MASIPQPILPTRTKPPLPGINILPRPSAEEDARAWDAFVVNCVNTGVVARFLARRKAEREERAARVEQARQERKARKQEARATK